MKRRKWENDKATGFDESSICKEFTIIAARISLAHIFCLRRNDGLRYKGQLLHTEIGGDHRPDYYKGKDCE
jgi:hypothetical protein